MTSFAQADIDYRKAVEAHGRELQAAFAAARRVRPDLNSDEITSAVLLRLKSFLLAQDLVKVGLDKVYAAPAADFFVETIAFYLRVVLEKLAPDLTVASERNIVRKQGSMRPDISIWRGTEVVAAIECKTQLGWNRHGWLKDFEDRESRLKADFPGAQLYLVVMTGSNWPGFGADTRVGTQFFVLMEELWPRDIDESGAIPIHHRVEALLTSLITRIGAQQAAAAYSPQPASPFAVYR